MVKEDILAFFSVLGEKCSISHQYDFSLGFTYILFKRLMMFLYVFRVFCNFLKRIKTDRFSETVYENDM